MTDSRLEIRKTYKLYIGGAFPRSESGRTYEVTDAEGRFLANVARASRKDARDAVTAARKAFGGWSPRTCGRSRCAGTHRRCRACTSADLEPAVGHRRYASRP